MSYRIAERVNTIKADKYKNYEILWNNYINDVLLSLSALYFFKDELHKFQNINDLTKTINSIIPTRYIDKQEKYTLKIDVSFDGFIIAEIKALQYLLDVMKQAKNFSGEEWLPNDTNKWLKKDGTYKSIFEAVVKKLKEENG